MVLNPATVANRIDKFAADISRLDRQVTEQGWADEGNYMIRTAEQQDARRVRRAPELVDQLACWEGIRAEQVATGKATGHSSETIHKGDAVRIRGHWRRVVRVNVKAASMATEYSHAASRDGALRVTRPGALSGVCGNCNI